MFGLQIHAPFDVIVIEFVAVFHCFLEEFNTLGVFHSGKRSSQNVIEFIEQTRRDHGIEESHFVGAFL